MNSDLIILIISLFCLLLSALCSSSETALTGVSKPYLLNQVKQGRKRALLLNNLLETPHKIIISLLVGNNIANVFFTTLITSVTIKYYGDQYTVVVALIITFIILMFAEILPKTYAYSYANTVAIFLAPLVFFISVILKPISFFFLYINKVLLKVIGSKDSTSSFGSLDNLRIAIETLNRDDKESESTVSHEKEMLHSILDLNDLFVSDIMKHRKDVICININSEINKNINKILGSAYNRLPVFKNKPDNIIGVIHVRDVFQSYMQNDPKINFNKLMKTPYFIPETTSVSDLLMQFRKNNERLALIVDEYGTFMGILTLGDILEEITGDLQTLEQSQHNSAIKEIGSSYIVDGTYKIRDLNRKMSWDLPDEDFTTVAGLILYETTIIPEIGNYYNLYGFKFEIIEKTERQLVKIKITPIE